tara:strand:+ start:1255 stop:1431 length:177 start_codon:yes stop_codon:yes gene_type:complete
MELLRAAIKNILWIDYGEFQGFSPEEDITLDELYAIQIATDLAIREKLNVTSAELRED